MPLQRPSQLKRALGGPSGAHQGQHGGLAGSNEVSHRRANRPADQDRERRENKVLVGERIQALKAQGRAEESLTQAQVSLLETKRSSLEMVEKQQRAAEVQRLYRMEKEQEALCENEKTSQMQKKMRCLLRPKQAAQAVHENRERERSGHKARCPSPENAHAEGEVH